MLQTRAEDVTVISWGGSLGCLSTDNGRSSLSTAPLLITVEVEVEEEEEDEWGVRLIRPAMLG